MLIKWSNTMRLDDYYTVKALRRQIALIDRTGELSKKAPDKRGEALGNVLIDEVAKLNETLRTFGSCSTSGRDIKRRVEVMKKVREDIGEVFLCSLRVANALDVDVSRSVHEKIYPALKKLDEPSI